VQGGIILWDGSSVVDELSYGGSFTVSGGVADGTVLTDVGITEEPTQAKDFSLQLTDTGWTGGGVGAEPLIAITHDAEPVAGLTLPVDINQIPGFDMYPNPVVDGNFIITSSNNSVKKQVKIYTITYQKVLSKSVRNNEKINVSSLSTGLYFLKVYEEGKLATRKLLINN